MPRKESKVSIAKQYLRPLKPDDPTNVYFVCKMKSCNSVLSGAKGCNLVAHFEGKHAEFFKECIENASSDAKVSAKDWEIRRLEQIHSLTEMVTINNRPFACLQDSGLVKLRSRELKNLQEAGYGDGLSGHCPAVMNHIIYLSSEVTNRIKLEIEDSLISLMIDIGSKNGRDILGLSIQFARNGRVVIRSIGMIQLITSHTALHIKDEILACLKTFNIKPSQIISITSDNASNMLAMIKLFNQESEGGDIIDENEHIEAGEEAEADIALNKNENIYDDDVISAEILNILEEFDSINLMTEAELRDAEEHDAEIMELLDDSSHYIELLKFLQNDFIMHTINSSGIRCAAHTLQLAVKNALKTRSVRVLIDMCRIACKLLRKSAYRNRMRDQNLKIVLPPLDCAVRWNSTYKMVIKSASSMCQRSLLILLLFTIQIDRECNPEM